MDDRARRFVDAAVKRGFVTPEQVEECSQLHETFREVGVEQRVEELLVKKGYLAEADAKLLSRALSAQKVGKYRIQEKLGEGGAGIVYKATQEPLERIVAIKILSRDRVDAPDYLDRFRREARTAVTLNHQNIVRGLDYGEADGYHYFVMEYVEGESVQQLIAREGMLAESRALGICLQAVEALRHAAEFNLVHRDIKPENILIGADGQAKVCDLGLAKPSMLETAEAVKKGGTIGTPYYMSPEQIRGKDEADFRSDIYSLGITIYEMTTGRPPFTGSTASEVVRKHLKEPPSDPREFNLNLSSAASAVILKMMAKKPADRYGSLDDLAEDLRAVLDGRPPRHTIQLGPKRPAKQVHIDVEDGAPRRARMGDRKKRSPLIFVAVLVVLAGGAAAAFFGLKGGNSATPTGPGPESGTAANVVAGASGDEEAKVLYQEAVDFARGNPDAPFESRRDRFQLVLDRYPASRWVPSAKDRIRELEEERDRRLATTTEAAREEWEQIEEAATGYLEENRYGEAIAAFRAFPEGYEVTDFPARAKRRAEELEKEAGEKVGAAIEKAASLLRRGDYDAAEEALDAVEAVGIAALEDRIRTQRDEIGTSRERDEEAREKGEDAYRSVLGSAYALWADGDRVEAENELVKAAETEVLTYYQEDLDRAWKDLREARRFADAIIKGARSRKGEREVLNLTLWERNAAEGTVRGADDDGIEISSGGREETFPYAALVPADRLRFAFLELDLESKEDHLAAACYLLAHGFLSEAEAENKAASMFGADPAPLAKRADYLSVYFLERAEADIRKAEILQDQGRPADALNALSAAAARAPSYGLVRYLAGKLLVEMSKFAPALEQLTRSRELGVTEQDLPYYLGVALLETGRREEGVRQLEEFLKSAAGSDPRAEDAELRITKLKAGELEQMIEELELQARTAMRRKNYNEAIDIYGKILDLDARHEETVFQLGRCYLENKDILRGYFQLKAYLEIRSSGRRSSEAKKTIRNLEREHGGDDRSRDLSNRGKEEYDAGNYASALKTLDEAVQAGPLYVNAYFNRAHTHQAVGQSTGEEAAYQRALDDFDVVLMLDPKEGLALEGKAVCLYYLNRPDEALPWAEKAIAEIPFRWQAFNIAGLAHYLKGRYKKALELFDRGLRAAPNELTLMINKALSLEGLGKKEQALAVLRIALTKDPTPAQIGQINEAMERLRK